MKQSTMKLLSSFAILGITGAYLMGNSANAADPSFKEGMWEFTTNMQMEGMPEMPKLPPGVKLPPGMSMSSHGNTMQVTARQCITKENMVPQDEKMKKNNCKITHQEHRGNTVTWGMVCTEEDMKMTSEGTATYTGDVMESKTTITTQVEGEPPMKQIVTAKGRYVGPCQK